MKTALKCFATVCIVTCMLLPMVAIPSLAEDVIPPFCEPVLEAWDAKNGEELSRNITEYWRTIITVRGSMRSIAIRLGGTTNELIDDHETWDVAIVSSNDVDLQALADAGVLIPIPNNPADSAILYQWLLPESVQRKLPVHPLYAYSIACYGINAQTEEAVFLICNSKDRPSRSAWACAIEILRSRSAEQIRSLEGLCLVNHWSILEIPEWTEADLLEHSDTWDCARLIISADEQLESLEQAGLLYDFSQDVYWTNRSPRWSEPNGVFSVDGRMIAIPFDPIITGFNLADKISVLVVNAKSPNLVRALQYAQHFMKSYEWLFGVIEDDGLGISYENPDIITKYGEHSICIYKDEVNW